MLTLGDKQSRRHRGKVRRTAEFIRPYAFGLASAVYLFGIGWLRPRNRAAIVTLTSHFGYRHSSREVPRLERISPSAVAPLYTLVEIHEPVAVDGNVSELELILLSRLAREANARTVFEIGTFDGRTTLNLAANSPPDARIYTLDLPRDWLERTASNVEPHERQFVDKAESGERFRTTLYASRIVQLYGDSATFDFSKYYDSIDLVFVDASHAYEYVINDSLQALRLLRNGRGTIVWHDYGRWDGVTAALHDLQEQHDSFEDVKSIEGTTLAVLNL